MPLAWQAAQSGPADIGKRALWRLATGNWQLAKPTSNITLTDIYLALDERPATGGNKESETSQCTVESGLQTRVGEVLDEIENGIVAPLGETTIADVHPPSCSYCGH